MLSKAKSEALLSKIRGGEEMTRREMLNLIVELSIPSMLAQVTTVLMFFIDASMVGHLGANASASIGLVESSSWLLFGVLGALSAGFSVQVAHYVGANDFARARSVFRHALIVGLLASFVVGLIGSIIAWPLPYWLRGGEEIAHDGSVYFFIMSVTAPFAVLYHLGSAMLKCSGDMRIPSMMSVLNCVLDVAFNYVFIYQFHLGVMGVAIGTAVAYMITSGLMTYQATIRNEILAFRLDTEPFRWVWGYVRRALTISAPLALQSVLMSGAQVVSTRIVSPLGAIAIGSNSLAVTAESLCYMPGYGLGDAATTLVGQSLGAGRKKLCRSFAWMTVGLGMIVMTVMGMVMFVFAPEMMAMLSPVAEIQTLGTEVLRIEAFAEPFFAAAIVSAAVCVGAGDTLKPAIINLGSMWFVRLTLAYVLAQSMGLKGVWIGMAIELTMRGCMFLLRLWKGHWQRTVVRSETA